MTTTRVFAVAAFLVCACAPVPQAPAQPAPQGSHFAGSPEQQWHLLPRLREISGLAVTADGRVFAHDDERGVIYEIDAEEGRLVKNFALGDPIETGDFEGIAITPSGDFYLVNSRGILFRFREGADGAHVAFDTIDTGLSDVCEIEGVAYFAAEESLILACKRNHGREMRDTVSLYAWPLAAAPGAAAASWLNMPEADLARAAGVERFRPSDVGFDGERIVLLSASDSGLVELARDGAILSARALGPGHRQPEGIAVLPNGALLISDEGGDGQALLSRYGRAQ